MTSYFVLPYVDGREQRGYARSFETFAQALTYGRDLLLIKGDPVDSFKLFKKDFELVAWCTRPLCRDEHGVCTRDTDGDGNCPVCERAYNPKLLRPRQS
jgi:hypothetical protein